MEITELCKWDNITFALISIIFHFIIIIYFRGNTIMLFENSMEPLEYTDIVFVLSAGYLFYNLVFNSKRS